MQVAEMFDTYELPEQPFGNDDVPKLLALSDGLARLDEKVSDNRLLHGLRERLLFEDACARFWVEGELIHLDELVQLDAGARQKRGDLLLTWGLGYLRSYRLAYADDATKLLSQELPGSRNSQEGPFVPPRSSYTARRMAERQFISTPRRLPSEALPDQSIDQDALVSWRRIFRDSSSLPAILHAAIAWDAWNAMAPESSGAWRGALIAGLVLKARGVTTNLLMPLNLGHRATAWRWDARVSQQDRLRKFMDGLETAARRATNLLGNMVLAEEGLRLRLAGRRKNSRLSGAIDLLLNAPVVSIPMLAKHLHMSHQGAGKLMRQLGSRPQLLTKRDRYRLWEIPLAG